MRIRRSEYGLKNKIPAWGRKFPLFIFLLVFTLNASGIALAAPGSMAADYLFETGRKFYQNGRYGEALKYIALLAGSGNGQVCETPQPASDAEEKQDAMERDLMIQESLSRIEAPLRIQEREQGSSANAVPVTARPNLGSSSSMECPAANQRACRATGNQPHRRDRAVHQQ